MKPSAIKLTFHQTEALLRAIYYYRESLKDNIRVRGKWTSRDINDFTDLSKTLDILCSSHNKIGTYYLNSWKQ